MTDSSRRGHFETMEPRLLLAADPLVVGAVYIEQDIGSDVHGDAFEITFEGGAPGTQLSRIEINTDQFTPGFSLGDTFFDISDSGYGADHSAAFSLTLLQTADPAATVNASVQDGGTLLVLDLTSFQAGDKLLFEIDVDEVQSFDPSGGDLDWINESFDPITSGIEFQGSVFSATFTAPHYHQAEGIAEFRNQYDRNLNGTGLNLPADDFQNRRDRTAGAVAHTQQEPLPVGIAGTVFLDSDLDLQQDANEAGIEGVALQLWVQDGGQYRPTDHSATTDANGDYQFPIELNLQPGTYQVRETQPGGLYSVGAIAGTVDGVNTGIALEDDPDVLTAISLPLGGQQAVDMDFAEAAPASVSGYVYHDRDNDGQRDAGEEGIGGVEVRVAPIDTVAAQMPVSVFTDADGFYRVGGLAPGEYEVVEIDQPTQYLDGTDTAGTVSGISVGAAVNPGDRIHSVMLLGGQAGLDYNFGELVAASIEGSVRLSDPQGNCDTSGVNSTPVAGAAVSLVDAEGLLVAETRTDANGAYRFFGLLPGEYAVIEVTPADLIDGADHVGTIEGILVGQLDGNDRIAGITIASGQSGVHYDFCEHLPASLSGYVYHDRDNNGNKDSDEEGIAGVTVELLGDSGVVVAEQVTDSDGHYAFTRLNAGDYDIRERHPSDWVDGLDTAGTIDGSVVGSAQNPGDRISDVQLQWGQSGEDYNFGELRYASISGSVHLTGPDGDCYTPGGDQPPLSGVIVLLQDESGATIAEDVTNASGAYHFDGLLPGVYTIIEQTPEGLIDGPDRVGTIAGAAVGQLDGNDRIGGISLASGQDAINYDFCEHEPALLAGYVYHDENRNGQFDSDESPIAGVTLTLLGPHGESLTAESNGDGYYEFTRLEAGTYTIEETQPVEFSDGLDSPGTLGGVADNPGDAIRNIPVQWGDQGRRYDFGEFMDGSISGVVHTDLNGDCFFDPDESPLEGVTIQLLDTDGEVLLTTHTDASGVYRFDGLAPGEYAVRELQPAGYLQGGQRVGSGGGDNRVQDRISKIPVGSGEDLTDYDFCEVPPSSLSGLVYADADSDCVQDPDEEPLSGVVIELLDSGGRVHATTETAADGTYRFEGLYPGNYSVRQQQPAGYFDGDQRVGSHGGNVEIANLIADILVPAGDGLEHYDFCERPPGVLSGYVFVDGPPMFTPDGQPLEPLRLYRDGAHTPDDTPLPGVVLELRGSGTGEPIMADQALPGIYADGPVRTTTDQNGYYEFRGLPAGEYAVFEVFDEPTRFDGIDTPGTTGGVAVNPGEPFPADYAEMAAEADNDAILGIPLAFGGRSEENNFSEVEAYPVVPRDRDPDPVPETPLAPVTPPPPDPAPVIRPLLQWNLDFPLYTRERRELFTWHLSVIDAGSPRGNTAYVALRANPWRSASFTLNSPNWQGSNLREGTWHLPGQSQVLNGDIQTDRELVFGHRGSVPIAGDFNGDGVDEIGVFYRGRWFLDINGNGIWDEEDLWAHLGGDVDLPVTGDWNGDGKDDIGIFGPEWEGDYRASLADPGLPDMRNEIIAVRNPKNVPPDYNEATDGVRVLQHTATGYLRADVIDHVFRYGAGIHLPVAGDWSGDGIKNIGVFHDGQWRLDADGDGRWSSQDESIEYGQYGDLPIVGDFNGDGVDEIGVFRSGQWIIDMNGNREMDDADSVFRMGQAGDHPVVGDWDGDGTDDPAVYRESADSPESTEDGDAPLVADKDVAP